MHSSLNNSNPSLHKEHSQFFPEFLNSKQFSFLQGILGFLSFKAKIIETIINIITTIKIIIIFFLFLAKNDF